MARHSPELSELAPLDPGCRVVPTPILRSDDSGQVLFSESASAFLRLSPSGGATVSRWVAGNPIGSAEKHHQLARRLEAIGLATISWPIPDELPACDVVIPVHNDLDGLRETLESLDGSARIRVVVVDDGSDSPIAADGFGHLANLGVDVLRREVPGGPGAARQLGFEHTESPLVAFVDAGVRADVAVLIGLCQAMTDPSLLAVAPRVRSLPGPRLVARYDAHRSPLDLGATPSLVGPGRPITYVPSACMVTRREAVVAVGGFDPALRYGEDVDLVWRLGRDGLVRYIPSFEVWHPPRSTVVEFLAQRVGYHSAATALAQRHGYDTLAPCRFSWWTVATLLPLLTGHPGITLASLAAHSVQLKKQLPADLPSPWTQAARATLRGNRQLGLSVASAAMRAWAPLLAPFLLARLPIRRPIRRLFALALARRLFQNPRRSTLADRGLDVAWGAADDLSSCAGLWVGGFRHRAVPPVRPVFVPMDAKARSTTG